MRIRGVLAAFLATGRRLKRDGSPLGEGEDRGWGELPYRYVSSDGRGSRPHPIWR